MVPLIIQIIPTLANDDLHMYCALELQEMIKRNVSLLVGHIGLTKSFEKIVDLRLSSKYDANADLVFIMGDIISQNESQKLFDSITNPSKILIDLTVDEISTDWSCGYNQNKKLQRCFEDQSSMTTQELLLRVLNEKIKRNKKKSNRSKALLLGALALGIACFDNHSNSDVCQKLLNSAPKQILNKTLAYDMKRRGAFGVIGRGVAWVKDAIYGGVSKIYDMLVQNKFLMGMSIGLYLTGSSLMSIPMVLAAIRCIRKYFQSAPMSSNESDAVTSFYTTDGTNIPGVPDFFGVCCNIIEYAMSTVNPLYDLENRNISAFASVEEEGEEEEGEEEEEEQESDAGDESEDDSDNESENDDYQLKTVNQPIQTYVGRFIAIAKATPYVLWVIIREVVLTIMFKLPLLALQTIRMYFEMGVSSIWDYRTYYYAHKIVTQLLSNGNMLGCTFIPRTSQLFNTNTPIRSISGYKNLIEYTDNNYKNIIMYGALSIFAATFGFITIFWGFARYMEDTFGILDKKTDAPSNPTTLMSTNQHNNQRNHTRNVFNSSHKQSQPAFDGRRQILPAILSEQEQKSLGDCFIMASVLRKQKIDARIKSPLPTNDPAWESIIKTLNEIRQKNSVFSTAVGKIYDVHILNLSSMNQAQQKRIAQSLLDSLSAITFAPYRRMYAKINKEIDAMLRVGGVKSTEMGNNMAAKPSMYIPTNEDAVVAWKSIIGLDYFKHALCQISVTPYYLGMKTTFKLSPQTTMLLYSLPGSGKTFTIRHFSEISGFSFFSVDASNLSGKYAGQAEGMTTALFDSAEKNAPSIIFIDEIDSIAPKDVSNSNSNVVTKLILQRISALIEGYKKDPKKLVAVIGATNHPDKIDIALVNRFQKKMYIPLPNKDSIFNMLKSELKSFNISDEIIYKVADILDGSDARCIDSILRGAKSKSLILDNVVDDQIDPFSIEAINNYSDAMKNLQFVPRQITENDLVEAAHKFRSTPSQDMFNNLMKFEHDIGSNQNNEDGEADQSTFIDSDSDSDTDADE